MPVIKLAASMVGMVGPMVDSAEHGNGEDQGAVWLAQVFGQHLGVMHDAEGAPDHHREQPGKQREGEPRVGEAAGPVLADSEGDCRGCRASDDRHFSAEVGEEGTECLRHVNPSSSPEK
jgi:hypothetical protein